MFRSDSGNWGLAARGLHWLMAAAIVGMLVLGHVMVEYPMSVTKLKLYAWHKSIGVTILALLLIRMLWRVIDERPQLPDGMGRAARRLARLTHVLLYLLMLVVPLSGLLINTASGFPLNVFGLFKIPPLMASDEQWQLVGEWAHVIAGSVLAALVIGHVAAALHHHFVRRDDLLKRMWRKS
ncbi:MAG: cytochrome b [Pseudomonadota bacterium]